MFGSTMTFYGQSAELLDSRMTRKFIVRRKREAVLSDISAAKSSSEICDVAKKNGLCDVCDFSALNIETSRSLLRCVTECLYDFPKVRGRFCYLGSKKGYLGMLGELIALDADVIKRLGVRHICSDDMIVMIAKSLIELIESYDYDGKDHNLLAQGIYGYGIVDGIIMDESDFSGMGFLRLKDSLRISAAAGFHPIGCEDVDYVVWHEVGHILDNYCNVTGNAEFLAYYNSLSPSKIINGLSEYAGTNVQEFFAEAFAEHKKNVKPREIARTAWKYLEKIYLSQEDNYGSC